MIGRAKGAGVASPYLYFVDPDGATLVEEYVQGPRLKEAAEGGSRRAVFGYFEQLGSSLARLHRAELMHGDMTTANVIIRNGALVFIDFGLSVHSSRLEDHAVDLRLIKETLTGAHSAIAVKAMEAVMRGYESISGTSRMKAVYGQLRTIERRGRYARLG